eukprot:13811205-Alexandrium_andersonii.AAC.1
MLQIRRLGLPLKWHRNRLLCFWWPAFLGEALCESPTTAKLSARHGPEGVDLHAQDQTNCHCRQGPTTRHA